MRGVLATTVMLHHVGLNTLIAKLTRGLVHDSAWGLSVDFFFMLSGFVLCQSFLRQTPSFRQYALKRVLRLYPLFIITTLIVMALTLDTHWDAATLIANLLAIQSLLMLTSINFPAWSIPFELFVPAIFVRAAFPLSRHPKLRLAIFALSLALSTYGAWLLAGGDDREWLRAIGGLTGGAALFTVWRARRAGPSKWAAALSLACFGLAIAVMAFSGVSRWLSLAFPALSAAAIWFGAQGAGLFSTAPFQALGGWSYSIYLLHIPLLTAAERVFGPGRVAGSAPMKLAIILTCLAAAAFSYRFVETPFINLGRRLTARPNPAA